MVIGGWKRNVTRQQLEELKGERDYHQQKAVETSMVMGKKQCNKIKNWNSIGWDGV